jgi:hypothetical protein
MVGAGLYEGLNVELQRLFAAFRLAARRYGRNRALDGDGQR